MGALIWTGALIRTGALIWENTVCVHAIVKYALMEKKIQQNLV